MERPKVIFFALVCEALFWAAAKNASADLIVSGGLVGVVVNQASTSQHDGADFTAISNPFSYFQSGSIPNGHVEASYQFAWSADSGTFLINASNWAGDVVSGVSSESYGHLLFTPGLDTLVTVAIHYDYELSGTLMSAVAGLGVSDETTGNELVGVGGVVYSFNGPVTGAFDDMRQAIIPAGCNCAFGYEMKLDTFDNSGLFATGSGYAQVTLQPYVPEPAAFLPLALGAVLVRVRRTGRHPLAIR